MPRKCCCKQLAEVSSKLGIESPSDRCIMDTKIADDLVGFFPIPAHVVGWLCFFAGTMICSEGKQRSFALNLVGQFIA